MAPDVFFYEAFAEEEQALRAYLPETVSAGFTWQTIQEYGQALPGAALISIRTQSAIPPEWAGHLQAILSRSTGFDHLNAYRRQIGRNLPCGYLPLYCHRAVAEQALLMWLALLRKLPKQMRQFQTFHRDGLTGGELHGRSLLVVGVGNIGYEVVKLGRGLGMQTAGVDLVQKHSDVQYGAIDELIGTADVIVCAMNLTKINHGYFDLQRLRTTKRGAIFVNISRGELSPPADLLELLEQGHLGGVGLDVYQDEGLLATALRAGRQPDDPSVLAVLRLAELDNVILTPHNAFNTSEAVARKSEQSAQQVLEWLNRGEFLWPVPPE
jgi:D-lactate dehydrogenase